MCLLKITRRFSLSSDRFCNNYVHSEIQFYRIRTLLMRIFQNCSIESFHPHSCMAETGISIFIHRKNVIHSKEIFILRCTCYVCSNLRMQLFRLTVILFICLNLTEFKSHLTEDHAVFNIHVANFTSC